jgi:hypothetical protein
MRATSKRGARSVNIGLLERSSFLSVQTNQESRPWTITGGYEPASVKANIAEALDNEGLATPARGLANQRHVRGLQNEVLQPVVHAPSRR